MPSSTRTSKKARTVLVDREKALLITSSVSMEKAFHFFTDVGRPAGVSATSIFDFADDLKRIDFASIEFHQERGDFSNWLRDVIGDNELADEFGSVQTSELSGEPLRSRLVEITDKRCRALANALKAS